MIRFFQAQFCGDIASGWPETVNRARPGSPNNTNDRFGCKSFPTMPN
jgi:hypothetical protein